MIDIDTHRIVDMIESRDLDKVTEWLKKYRNIHVVSRDGSIIYKSAISTAHPSAIQVSDPFHLIKNLTDYCQDYLKNKFQSTIILGEKELATNEEVPPITQLTLQNKWEKARKLLDHGVPKSTICKQVHIDICLFDKLALMTNDELLNYFSNRLETRQATKRAQKIELVKRTRALYKEIKTIQGVAKEVNLDRRTVRKYLDPNFQPVYSRNRTTHSILDPYEEQIRILHKQRNTSEFIYSVIVGKGYKGSKSTLRRYCSKLKKERNANTNCNPKKEVISVKRKDVLKLLYKPASSVKTLSNEMVNLINEKHPFFKQIIDLVGEFKDILKMKKIEQLEEWIKKAKKLNITYIDSFVNGITRDIDAVKNAIIYDYNNGLAEGSVNKLKVIKRIMYGRNNFEMLRKKVLYLELNKKIN